MEKKKEMKKWLILILIVLIGYWIVNNVNTLGHLFGVIMGILSPFILGGCLAFILNIPMTFFEKKLAKIKNKKGKTALNKKALRITSLIFAILVIALVFVLIVTLIVPELINIIKMLIENLPFYVEEISNLIKEHGEDFVTDINQLNIDQEAIKSQLLNQLSGVLTSSISIVSGIVSAVYNFIIGIIFAIYILIDKEKLQKQIKKLLRAYVSRKKVKTILKLGKISNKTFRKFFTVQCLEATILGVLSIIGMLILGIPYAVPIGILIGVTALIPIVGAFIGVIIGAVLILSVSPIKVITFIIFFLILQQIEGNLIYPRVVGSSIGLPGMWVLVAVAVGGSLGGIIGMLLGVPIVSILYTLLKEDVDTKLNL